MTTSTLFSNVPENQNQGGQPFVPANTVVDTGAGTTTRPMFTLTVTPSTGWGRATVGVSADNVSFLPLGEVYATPGIGTQTQTMHPPLTARRYYSATAMTVSPGATCTLTMTF